MSDKTFPSSVARRRDVLVQHDVEARMRDGVVLRASVYRPADDGRYPVLLSRRPTSRRTTCWTSTCPARVAARTR